MTTINFSKGFVYSMEHHDNEPTYQQQLASLESLLNESNHLITLTQSIEHWDNLIQQNPTDKTLQATKLGLESMGTIAYKNCPSLESLDVSNESLKDIAEKIKSKAISFNKKIKEALQVFFNMFSKQFEKSHKEAVKLLKEIEHVDFKENNEENQISVSNMTSLFLDGSFAPSKVVSNANTFINQYVIDAKWRQPWIELDKLIDEKVNSLKEDAKVSDLIKVIKEVTQQRDKLFNESKLKSKRFKVSDSLALGFELKGTKISMQRFQEKTSSSEKVPPLTKGQTISLLENIAEQTDKVSKEKLDKSYHSLLKDNELTVSNENYEDHTTHSKRQEILQSTKKLVKSFLGFVAANMIQTTLVVAILSQLGGWSLAKFFALFTTGFTISVKIPGIFAICLVTAIIFGYINRDKILVDAVSMESLDEKEERQFKSDVEMQDQEARNRVNEIVKDVYKQAEYVLNTVYQDVFKLVRASY